MGTLQFPRNQQIFKFTFVPKLWTLNDFDHERMVPNSAQADRLYYCQFGPLDQD